jgi:hypothetical protein
MTNLETITAIDSNYAPDPDAMIPVVGQWVAPDRLHPAESRTYVRDFEIVSDAAGPVIWPGAWFLPYGGIYFNPVNLTILGESG